MPETKRKPGRPTLPKGEAKAETLRIRVTASDLKSLTAKAKASKQTVSELIRSILNATLEA
jgi:hypothetical protein